jgi:hypothetical protein
LELGLVSFNFLATEWSGRHAHMRDSRRRPGDEDEEDEDTELSKNDEAEEVVRLRAGMGIALLDVAGEDMVTVGGEIAVDVFESVVEDMCMYICTGSK